MSNIVKVLLLFYIGIVALSYCKVSLHMYKHKKVDYIEIRFYNVNPGVRGSQALSFCNVIITIHVW